MRRAYPVNFDGLVTLALSQVPPILTSDPAFVTAVRKAVAMRHEVSVSVVH